MSPLSQLKTKLLNTIETVYTVAQPGGLLNARREVGAVVDEVFAATGNCEKCFGRGYLIDNQAGKYCDCPRAERLKEFVANYA